MRRLAPLTVTDLHGETAARVAFPLLLAALLAWPAVAPADEPAQAPASPPQVRPWSVSLGTGGGGFVEFVDALSNGGPGGYGSSRRQGRIQLNARVERDLDRWFRAGVAWTYNRWTEAYFTGSTQIGSVDNSVHALMAGVTLRWLRAGYVELQSGIAAGAARWGQAGQGIGVSQDGVQSGFAFQLRAIGISAGNEQVRVFAELGVGFEGLLIGGLTLRF